jgi:hypothetical protein
MEPAPLRSAQRQIYQANPSQPAMRIGFDLAKNAFQVHGAGAEGEVVVARKVRRALAQGKFSPTLPNGNEGADQAIGTRGQETLAKPRRSLDKGRRGHPSDSAAQIGAPQRNLH